MKQITKLPYINNLMRHYRFHHGRIFSQNSETIYKYRDWLKQFGFQVPIKGDYLEFPDDYPDEKITMFILRWS